MIDIDRYYEAIITDSLSIDAENYELLMVNVRDACKEDGLYFNEYAFRSLFLGLIASGKIISLHFDQRQQVWHEKIFNPQELPSYWFRLQKVKR